MKKMDIVDTFAMPLEAFMALFFSDEYQVALHEHLKFHHRDVLVREDDDYKLFLRIDLLSGEKLPWVARKLWGDYVGWIEETTVYKAEHRVETRILPKILGRYIDTQATMRFAEDGPGRCSRATEIRVKVSVPAFGRAIAKKVALNLEDGFAQMATFTDRYIAEHGR